MSSTKTHSKLVMVACLGLVSAISSEAMALASAELYSTQANVYGRFEARLRFAAGDGVISSFFLWKEGSSDKDAYWNELDFEKVGADCHLQTNNIYGRPSANHEQKPQASGLCDSYHDYRFEWTPTYIAWFLDDKEIRRDTGEAVTAYTDNAKAGLTFHFNIWPGNQDFGGNINNTTLPVREYISWVQYSAFNNGSFEQKWREDFQGPALPEGWAAGDWTSPFNLSTHNPKNVGIVNGIAVLAITADGDTGNLGTPPVDPNGGGGGSGGNSGSGGSTGKSSSSGSSSSGGSAVGGSVSSGGNPASSSSVSGGATSAGGTSGSAASGGAGGTQANTGGAGGGAGQGGTSANGGTTSGGSNSGGSAGQSASSSSSGGSTSNGGNSNSSVSSSGGSSGSSSNTAQGGSTSSSSKASSGGSSGKDSSSASSSSGGASDSSSGCGCRLGMARPAAPSILVLFLLGVALLSRIRRKGV